MLDLIFGHSVSYSVSKDATASKNATFDTWQLQKWFKHENWVEFMLITEGLEMVSKKSTKVWFSAKHGGELPLDPSKPNPYFQI